jgi:hypothetical protein
METTDAIHLVNERFTTYPGFRVAAFDHSHRYQHAIRLRVTILGGRNSDQAQAPTYRQRVTDGGPWADFPLDVSGLAGPADLIGAVLDILAGVWAHEVREFTRYRDDTGAWIAPFHPHTSAGIAAWSERTGQLPALDYAYGVA